MTKLNNCTNISLIETGDDVVIKFKDTNPKKPWENYVVIFSTYSTPLAQYICVSHPDDPGKKIIDIPIDQCNNTDDIDALIRGIFSFIVHQYLKLKKEDADKIFDEGHPLINKFISNVCSKMVWVK